MARIIGEVRPRFAFVENSPMLVTRGLERVLADLTAMGYDSRWGVISAADIGAKHKRERIWIVAHANSHKHLRQKSGSDGAQNQMEREFGKENSSTRQLWGTPKAQDSRHALRDRGKGNLGEQVSGLHNGGKLNPLWTEWLMGWWIGWTDLKPLVMDKSPCVQQLHGDS
jgi:DNA (cytosine-5)-methyltransferase 1